MKGTPQMDVFQQPANIYLMESMEKSTPKKS